MTKYTNVFLYISLIFIFCVENIYGSSSIDWSIIETEDTLHLFLKDIAVGKVLSSIRVDSNKKMIYMHNQTQLEPGATTPGGLSGMHLEETAVYDFSGKQVSARQYLKSPAGKSVWDLQKNSSHTWEIRVSTGGVEKKSSIETVHGSLLPLHAIYKAMRTHTMAVNQSWTDTLFDLTSMSHIIVKTTCIQIPSVQHDTYIFINKDNVLNREERWECDRSGRTILKEIPPFFVAKRIDPQTSAPAHAGTQQFSYDDLVELFKVKADRGPDSSQTIALTLQEPVSLHESVQEFYTRKNKQYVLKTFPTNCTAAVSEPAYIPDGDWISPTITIQSDNPEIKKLTHKITAGTHTKCEIVKRITFYVYKHIEKKNTPTFSNASETLEAGFGDCGEHAVLAAAMLRAADIKATVILGLVYVEAKKGYFYHAWVAAYTDKLIFTDPALGVFPASRGYIPLVIDSDGRNMVHLGAIVDRISVSYVPRLKNNN